MIAHIVVFEFKPDVNAADVEAFHAELSAMRARLGDLIKEYYHGPSLGLREGPTGYGVTTIVESEADLHSYLDDEEHIKIGNHYGPILFASRNSAQITVD